MNNDIIWIDIDVVLAIHQRQILEHGGVSGVRDTNLLISALNKPRHHHYYNIDTQKQDLCILAALYAFGIVNNHPFIDGNKRTGYVTMRLFLTMNGADIHALAVDKYIVMMKLASNQISKEGLADWIRTHIIMKPIPNL